LICIKPMDIRRGICSSLVLFLLENAMKKILLGVVLLAMAAPGVAQTAGGPFIDVSIGRMKADLGNTSGFSVDNKDTSYSIGAGYMFNRHIGAELGYRDLGDVSGSATATFNNTAVFGNTVTGTGRLSFNGGADGYYFGFVLRAPVHEKFDFVGRAGWFRSEAPVSVTVSFAGTVNGAAVAANASASQTFKDTEPYWGVGGTYNFNRNFGLSLEYSKYKLAKELDTKVDVWALRASYRF
jgi:OmpA-OmpF porin, OOP family